MILRASDRQEESSESRVGVVAPPFEKPENDVVPLSMELYESYLSLAQESFSSPSADVHLANYPLVLGEDNLDNIRVVVEEGRVVSGAASWPLRTQFGGREIVIGEIGNVATDPAHRGQGLASSVILDCEEQLRKQGCLLACLWSNKAEFYSRLGYVDAGTEWIYRPTWKTVEREDVVPRRIEDVDEMVALYSEMTAQRQVGAHWTESQARALLSIPGMTFSVLDDFDRGPTAFMIQGKGIDLPNVVHEWGGDPDSVIALINAVADRNQRKARVLVPDHSTLMRLRLQTLHFRGVPSPLALMKVLDARGLASWLNAFLVDMKSDVQVEGHDNGWVWKGDAGHLGTPIRSLPTLLMGRRGMCPGRAELSEVLQRNCDGIVPQSFFIWGLESC